MRATLRVQFSPSPPVFSKTYFLERKGEALVFVTFIISYIFPENFIEIAPVVKKI